MKVTLKFHKALQKFTNNIDSITIDVINYYDLIVGAVNLFPDLEKYFKTTYKNGLREELLLISNNKLVPMEDMFLPAKESTLVPAIFGTGSKGGLIAGIGLVSLVAISFATGGFGALAATGTVGAGAPTGVVLSSGAVTGTAAATSLTLAGKIVLGIGINLILGSLAPKPEINDRTQDTPDAAARTENNIFGSLANSTDTGATVWLIYGLHRVSGQFISGYVKTRNHGKEDTIKVGEEFS